MRATDKPASAPPPHACEEDAASSEPARAPRALALIGSPRKGGNTDCLADAFLAGAAAAGAETEKIYLDDCRIRPIAEVGDVFRERVDLRADDDWRTIAQQVVDADILAWGAPVYWQGVPAQMKCFVDRWSAFYASRWLNRGMANKIWVLLCPYGHPTQDESHWIVAPVQAWAERWRSRYLGDVCVRVAKKGAVVDIPEAMHRAKELGREAVAECSGQLRAGGVRN